MLDDPDVQAWLLVAVAIGCVVASIVLWRRRTRPEPPAAAEPDPPEIPPNDDPLIEDGREITPTRVTLTWERPGQPSEQYEMEIETVTPDGIVFAGTTRRLDTDIVAWRLFHTLRLPAERLGPVTDAAGRPIPDMRTWLRNLAALSPPP